MTIDPTTAAGPQEISPSRNGLRAEVTAQMRARLARDQSAFIAALLTREPDRLGLDPIKLGAAQRGLFHKRICVMGHLCPGLSEAIRASQLAAEAKTGSSTVREDIAAGNSSAARRDGAPTLYDLAFDWHLTHPKRHHKLAADCLSLMLFLQQHHALPQAAAAEYVNLRIRYVARMDGSRQRLRPRRGPFLFTEQISHSRVTFWGLGRFGRFYSR